MKKITIIASVSFMLSCSNEKKPIEQTNEFESIAKSFSTDYSRTVKLMTIDSCEYIVWSGSHGEVGFCHKGNCKNH